MVRMASSDLTPAPGVDRSMAVSVAAVHQRAAATGLTLHHVLHPFDLEQDEWTRDYRWARTIYERLIRDDGGARLHVEIHQPRIPAGGVPDADGNS